MLDDIRAEGLAGEVAGLEESGGLGEGGREARVALGGVGVALEGRGRLDAVRDAVEARGERGGVGEVGVAVIQSNLEPARPMSRSGAQGPSNSA